MMKRLCAVSLLAACVGAGVLLVACSDDESRGGFAASGDAATGSPGPSLPPGPSDAEAPDAGPKPRPSFDLSDVPVSCAQTPCAVELVAGEHHFCARLQDGTMRCWGDNTLGALGGGAEVVADVGVAPVVVSGVTNATQITAAAGSTCARLADGSVKCWGDNADGQLGLAEAPAQVDWDAHPTPAPVALNVEVSRVDLGQRGACALGAAGTLLCWGANDQQQLARPSAGEDPQLGPGAADLRGSTVIRAGAGRDSSFGLSADGKLLGWGVVWGRLASVSPDPAPFALPSLASVTSFAVGSTHACAIAGGETHCWGESMKGALATGLPDIEKLPVRVHISSDEDQVAPQQVAVSTNSTCVRLTDGAVECCGDDTTGQLGRGTAGSLVPLFGRATAFTGYAVRVATSASATCALVQGGTVECWGGNAAGELGQGTHDDDAHPSPVRVTFQ